MSITPDLLRSVISLILEADDETDTTDDNEPRGPHQYRSSSGEIVTLPDYTNLPIYDIDITPGTQSDTKVKGPAPDVKVDSKAVSADFTPVPGESAVTSIKYGVTQSLTGARLHPVKKTVKEHTGVDIARTDKGTRGIYVYAAKGGTIVKSAGGGVDNDCASNGGAGNYIIIKHSDGTGAKYAHLETMIFSPTVGSKSGTKQQVNAGSVIGTVGSTGCSTGPHLHFELLVDVDNDGNYKGYDDPTASLRQSGYVYPIQVKGS